MKKKTVYEPNASTIAGLIEALEQIRHECGPEARIRDVYFSQDVEQGALTRTVSTDLHITVEDE